MHKQFRCNFTHNLNMTSMVSRMARVAVKRLMSILACQTNLYLCSKHGVRRSVYRILKQSFEQGPADPFSTLYTIALVFMFATLPLYWQATLIVVEEHDQRAVAVSCKTKTGIIATTHLRSRSRLHQGPTKWSSQLFNRFFARLRAYLKLEGKYVGKPALSTFLSTKDILHPLVLSQNFISSHICDFVKLIFSRWRLITNPVCLFDFYDTINLHLYPLFKTLVTER